MAIHERISELLVRHRMVSPAQVRQARASAWRSRSSLAHELVRSGVIQEHDLTSFLGRVYDVPVVDLSDLQLPQQLVDLIPGEVAQRHTCVPIDRAASALIVAIADPSNLYAIDDLKFVTGCNIEVVVASASAIQNALTRLYPEDHQHDIYTGDIIGEPHEHFTFTSKEENTDELVNAESAPVIRLVNAILAEALKHEASELHIELSEEEFCVRLRMDGVLIETMRPPMAMRNAVSSRIKLMSDLDIAEIHLPQDGRLKWSTDHGQEVTFRVSVCPTSLGEKIVLHLPDGPTFSAT